MLIQPVLRPVLQPVLRSIFDPGIGGGGGTPIWTPASLYAAGEQGVWFDESDLSSMFQSAVNHGGLLIPVTAADQPVAARMDKHIDVGWVVVGDAVWAKTKGDGVLSVVGNVVTVTGATTVTHITRIAGSIPAVPGSARMSIVANYAGATGVQSWLRGAPRALTNNVPVTVVNALTNSSLERLDVSSGTVSFTINELSYWRGNHWTALNNSARPILRLTGGLYSLEWDGVDDAGSTPSINFTGTDKMGVFYGMLPTTSGMGLPVELSSNAASNSGAFYSVSGLDVGTYDAQLARGDAVAGPSQQAYFVAALGVSVPYVMAATHDIAGDLSTARRNAIAGANVTGDKGAGNFGNYPLYIGARNNASFFFKGHTYGEIVRGSASTASEIASTEAYLAAKTGVTLP